jgi:hypothetical protein
MKRLIDMNHYVQVSQQVKKERKGKVVTNTEKIHFGPLLDDKGDGSTLRLVWPSMLFDAQQTAEQLSLTYKDQKHSICRLDPRLNSDIFLQLLYRNDVEGIAATISFWQDAKRYFDERGGRIDDDDPWLDKQPPEIWFASSGGGGVTAGEKGCPSFSSTRLTKDAPDAFIAGGRKDTVENRALDSVSRRNVRTTLVLLIIVTHEKISNCSLMSQLATFKGGGKHLREVGSNQRVCPKEGMVAR